MSKSYLLWAIIGMIGYSVTATLVKLATQSGRFSSYFVLMISSAMVVATSTAITIFRGDMKTFSRDNLASVDGMLVLGAKARRFQSSGGVFCSASSPAAHRTGFPFPPKAPWPPLPGCWTPIGVALDVSERLVNPLRACNKISQTRLE